MFGEVFCVCQPSLFVSNPDILMSAVTFLILETSRFDLLAGPSPPCPWPVPSPAIWEKTLKPSFQIQRDAEELFSNSSQFNI